MEAKPFTESALIALQKQRGISGREKRLAETALSLSHELARLKEARSRQVIPKDIEEGSKRAKVLVVVYADGAVECYADKSTDVKVAHFPRVMPQNEVIAEKIVEWKLPGVYREIYLPGNLKAYGASNMCPSAIEMDYCLEMKEAMKLIDSIPKDNT